jgi:hypothetical protein
MRAVELLEDLCEAMADYTLAPLSSSSSGARDGGGSDAAEQQQPLVWVKHKGAGRARVPKSLR